MKISSEEVDSILPRKGTISLIVPVPKPTQVGEERILRRAEEPLLRNSAKYPRNFGRRGAERCIPHAGKASFGLR